jgi:hypothetical protein
MFELTPEQEFLILKRIAKRHPKTKLIDVDRILTKAKLTILDRDTKRLMKECSLMEPRSDGEVI